jgi:hypothetical protein
MPDFIEAIRERIDAKHSRALQALAEIEQYLAESDSSHVGNGAPKPARTGAGKSNREKVFALLGRGWTTVPEIIKEAKLQIKQVRGVLNAKGLDTIESRLVEGTTTGQKEYRLKPS